MVNNAKSKTKSRPRALYGREPCIFLFKDMVLATDLSYERACSLLAQAERTPAARLLTFFLARPPKAKGWSLISRVEAVTRAFIENPDGFVIPKCEKKTKTR